MQKRFNLRLFDGEGTEAATAAGTTAGNGDGNLNAGNATLAYSFAQAEEIANARAQRAEKAALASYFKQQGMSEEEANKAIAEYKAQQEATKPDMDKIAKERDAALAELAALKNGNALRAKGVRDDDIEYVMFKVGKLMQEDNKLDFETAVGQFLKDNPRYTAKGTYMVKTGTDASEQGSAPKANDSINNAIRAAARR